MVFQSEERFIVFKKGFNDNWSSLAFLQEGMTTGQAQ
jgi:hypothetical protein